MGKTRDLFKKFGDTKGTFPSRVGTIKNRNGKDLTETEEIKKRWGEYTKELYKKGPNNLDNHNGLKIHQIEVVTLSAMQKQVLRHFSLEKTQ